MESEEYKYQNPRLREIPYFSLGGKLFAPFKTSVPSELLGAMALAYIAFLSDYIDNKYDIIITPPMSFERKQRQTTGTEFNLSISLCETIKGFFGAKYYPDALERIYKTISQKESSAWQRFDNMNKNLVVNRKYLSKIRDRHIIVFDDVVTTGATLFECERTLLKAGAAKVFMCAFVSTGGYEFNKPKKC